MPARAVTDDTRLDPEQRRERAQVLVRKVNEEIRRISAEFDVGAGAEWELDLVCECVNDGCFERLAVLPAEYDEVRRFPARFIVKPGHANVDGERVTDENERFVVVEKRPGEAVVAIVNDPRRPEPDERPIPAV